jgi:hypothetical protein
MSWVMLGWLVDLFAIWWTGGRTPSVVVWEMVPSCHLWCLWRKINNRHFEDCEKTLEELKSFFYSLYTWAIVFVAPLVISFNDFSYLIFSF